MKNWNLYLKKTNNKKPRPLLVEALSFAKKGRALDMGCGVGNDSIFLRENGFQVDSFDSNVKVQRYLPEAKISSFEEFEYEPDAYALVNAQYALPFCAPENIQEVINKVKNSLVKRGVFVGQFFGKEDSWNGNSKMNFQDAEQVKRLLEGLEILSFKEEKSEEKTILGEPHFWHIYHFIARK